MENPIQYSVFTKPWQTKSLAELGSWVRELGFDGIELPVRPGYQITPETVEQLPAAAKVLANEGVKIFSVAGPSDERTIAACAKAGVPILRVMARIQPDESYVEAEIRLRVDYDRLMPLLTQYGVQLGVQNHCNRFIANALGVMRLIDGFPRDAIAVVWDAAHEALEGSLPSFALDVAWDSLCMINLKNGVRQRVEDDPYAQWKVVWTPAKEGYASWPNVISELKKREYAGVVCLTAEYSNHAIVNEQIREDLAWAKELFAGVE